MRIKHKSKVRRQGICGLNSTSLALRGLRTAHCLRERASTTNIMWNTNHRYLGMLRLWVMAGLLLDDDGRSACCHMPLDHVTPLSRTRKHEILIESPFRIFPRLSYHFRFSGVEHANYCMNMTLGSLLRFSGCDVDLAIVHKFKAQCDTKTYGLSGWPGHQKW